MELNHDIKNEIVRKRIELIDKEKELSIEYNRASYNLNDVRKDIKKLQRDCKHENAVVHRGYQGGGIYYCKCTCLDCGRSGYRYIPQYHMNWNNKWYKDCPQRQITLEEAIKIGKDMEGRILGYGDYWWGEVEDYDKLIKDSNLDSWV